MAQAITAGGTFRQGNVSHMGWVVGEHLLKDYDPKAKYLMIGNGFPDQVNREL